ncbi:MAG: glyoxalase [Deltaproteobacteria bacterium]|nr:MAG: glyoxalase [Deltaproteobacteria bacterium]
MIRFHLAFPVHDLDAAERFYVEGLGCTRGRRSEGSLILNFFGHQIVAHRVDAPPAPPRSIYPRHFGLVFDEAAAYERLVERIQARGIPFYRGPGRRFVGQPMEHRHFFLEDPSHNLLEFKYYERFEAVFGMADDPRVGDASDAQGSASGPAARTHSNGARPR